MNLFEKHDPDTWMKEVGYPAISILDPDTDENIYWGRNPKEYFKEFNISFYQDCKVLIWQSKFSFTELGTIKLLENYLPEVCVTIEWEKIK